MNVEPLEAAYLAGLFDGESFIGGVYLNSRPAIQIAISMTAKEPIDRIRELFGGYYREYIPKTSKKMVYSLQIGGASAKPVLEILMPYLKVKRRQAALALAFIETIGEHGVKVSDHDQLLRGRLVDLLKELNA